MPRKGQLSNQNSEFRRIQDHSFGPSAQNELFDAQQAIALGCLLTLKWENNHCFLSLTSVAYQASDLMSCGLFQAWEYYSVRLQGKCSKCAPPFGRYLDRNSDYIQHQNGATTRRYGINSIKMDARRYGIYSIKMSNHSSVRNVQHQNGGTDRLCSYLCHRSGDVEAELLVV